MVFGCAEMGFGIRAMFVVAMGKRMHLRGSHRNEEHR